MTCAGRESLGFYQSILLPKILGATEDKADTLMGRLLPSHSSEIDKAQKYLAGEQIYFFASSDISSKFYFEE